MAEPGAVYQNNTPSLENGGLNALQLALANYMAVGNPPPFAVNNAFMQTMKTFTDPGELSPFDLDTKTGLPRVPDLLYTVNEGISYIAKGEDIYLVRRAQDCGPDENRLEEVFLGKRPDVAAGTWSFYGMIRGGSVAGGSTFSGEEGFVASLGTSIASGFTGDPNNPSASATSVAAAIAAASPGASIADVSAAVAAATGVGVNAATQATVNATQSSGFAGDPGSSGDGGDGAKIICSRLYRLGYMPDNIFAADQQFGKWLQDNDPYAYWGYIAWASVVVDWMNKEGPTFMFWIRDKDKRNRAQQQLVLNWSIRIALPWAYHMAYRMGEFKEDNRAGRVIMKTGLFISRIIGRLTKANKPTKSPATGYLMWAAFSVFWLLAALKGK